jgi:hypothetical protein
VAGFHGTKREAEKRLRQILREVDEGKHTEKMTAGDLCRQWLDDYVFADDELKRRTRESYEETVRVHILPELGDVLLEKLTPVVVQEFLNKKRQQRSKHGRLLSQTTVRYIHTILKPILYAGVEWEYIPRNPAVSVAVTRIYDHETYERKKKAALELEAWFLSEEPQAERQTPL